jgi:aminoglycoside 2''-phosphotransferase
MQLQLFKNAIARHFPQLQVESLTFFAEGWANCLCLVNHTLVFRFPRDTHGGQQLLHEIRLLPVLAPYLPLAVPDYQYAAPASEYYPHPFAGYPLLPGISLAQTAEAVRQSTWWRPAVGDFLTALHAVPPSKLTAVGVEGYLTAEDWCAAITAKHGPFEEHVLPLLTAGQGNAIAHYLLQAVRDERMLAFTPVVIHQDFGYHNYLVDTQARQVTGVVDFGCCSIGDPVLDVLDPVRPYYRGVIDPGWDFRAEYYRRTSALEDLLYICTTPHPIPNGEAVRSSKLHELAALWPT